METYDITPQYSTNEIVGRCVRCQAEHDMNSCLMSLLGDDNDGNDEETEKKFQALLTFLKSPESQKLIDESERYLSEGKKVNVKLYVDDGQVQYALEIQ
jgi:hypothetical protein